MTAQPIRCPGRAPAFITLAPGVRAWFYRVCLRGLHPAVPCSSSFLVKLGSMVPLFENSFLHPGRHVRSCTPSQFPGVVCSSTEPLQQPQAPGGCVLAVRVQSQIHPLAARPGIHSSEELFQSFAFSVAIARLCFHFFLVWMIFRLYLFIFPGFNSDL